MNKLQTIKFSCKLIPCFALIKLIQNVPPSPPLVPLLHFIVLHPYPLSHHTNAPFKTLTIGPDSCAVVNLVFSSPGPSFHPFSSPRSKMDLSLSILLLQKGQQLIFFLRLNHLTRATNRGDHDWYSLRIFSVWRSPQENYNGCGKI
jgi:hypothetical protein